MVNEYSEFISIIEPLSNIPYACRLRAFILLLIPSANPSMILKVKQLSIPYVLRLDLNTYYFVGRK